MLARLLEYREPIFRWLGWAYLLLATFLLGITASYGTHEWRMIHGQKTAKPGPATSAIGCEFRDFFDGKKTVFAPFAEQLSGARAFLGDAHPVLSRFTILISGLYLPEFLVGGGQGPSLPWTPNPGIPEGVWDVSTPIAAPRHHQHARLWHVPSQVTTVMGRVLPLFFSSGGCLLLKKLSGIRDTVRLCRDPPALAMTGALSVDGHPGDQSDPYLAVSQPVASHAMAVDPHGLMESLEPKWWLILAFLASIGLISGFLGWGYWRVRCNLRIWEARRRVADLTPLVGKERAERILSGMGGGLIATDRVGRVTGMNPMAERLTGHPVREALKRPLGEVFRILDGQSRGPLPNPVALALDSGDMVQIPGDTLLIAKDGSERIIENFAAPIHGRLHSIQGALLIFQDVTEKRRLEQQVSWMATHDTLTALPNRALLMDRIEQAIVQARHSSQRVGIALLDLDGFKQVNDRLGHVAGDTFLRETGRRLRTFCRAESTVARLGGDEFAIVFNDFDGAGGLSARLDALMENLREPVLIDGEGVVVSASVGVTIFPIDSEDPQTLLRYADLAMSEAKAQGRNGYHFFDDRLERIVHRQHENRQRAIQALDRGEFTLYYQPQVQMAGGALLGVEALLRWQDPEGGVWLPGPFLASLANTPSMRRLNCWVLETALAQACAWAEEGLQVPVAANLSPDYLTHPQFLGDVRELLIRYPIAPGMLELEIPENTGGGDIERLRDIIKVCKQMNLSVALDDVGTGASSLVHLQRIPTNILKIDTRFVRHLFDGPENMAIVEAICTFAHRTGRRVIAEGVESEEAGEALLRLGCRYGQGNAIAVPMPAAALHGWLQSWKPYPRWQGMV